MASRRGVFATRRGVDPVITHLKGRYLILFPLLSIGVQESLRMQAVVEVADE